MSVQHPEHLFGVFLKLPGETGTFHPVDQLLPKSFTVSFNEPAWKMVFQAEGDP